MPKSRTAPFAAAAALVGIAVACRAAMYCDGAFPARLAAALPFVRAGAYILLFSGWARSLWQRIVHRQARRYLIAIAALMLFWMLVRTVRFLIPGYPPSTRYLWYLYYLPMLFLPLLFLLLAASLGKAEEDRLPKWTRLLYAAAATYFLFILLNDVHQTVFFFPQGVALWHAEGYRYRPAYFLFLAWCLGCAAGTAWLLRRHCRGLKSRRVFLLPLIPLSLMALYTLLYLLGVPALRVFLGDMTAVYCLLLAATLESLIQTHIIPSNLRYTELFYASALGAQITDESFRVLLASNAAQAVPAETMKESTRRPVLLPNSLRLSSAPISTGYVLWTEDVSELLTVLEQLREVREELSDERDILAEEYRLQEKRMRIEELDGIYTDIQRETAAQIDRLSQLLERFDASSSEEERVLLLKEAAVIGAYIKRRSNLLLNGARHPLLPANEVGFTFRDTIENLALFDVTCTVRSRLSGKIAVGHLKSVYDFFERIAELSLGHMSVINGSLEETAEGLRFTVTTDSGAELSGLAGAQASVQRDEDGDWQLVLRLAKGGGFPC